MGAPVLNVAVVGGGIAGLTTALTLHETGHNVIVYERKPGVQTIGGPLAVMPNGVRALKNFGIGDALGGEVRKYDVPWRWRKWNTGEFLSEMSSDMYSKAFGETNWTFARAELQRALWQLVEHKGIPIEASANISSVIESEPALVFEDGRKVKVDLIVGADGIHSIVRDSFLKRDEVEIQTPGSYYMVDCPRSKVAQHPDPEVSRFMNETTFWMGPQRSATCSHLKRDGDRYHMSIFVPHDLSPVGVWGRHGRTSDVKKYLHDFHSSLDKLLDLIEDKDCYVWRLAQIEPLRTWLSPSQRVVIIGDAAHAMVPNAAQGATMGIEDAATLAVILSKGISSKSDIPAALRTFETLRKPRCEFVVARAAHREKLYHLEDGPAQEARDKRMKQWGQMYTVDQNVWDGKHIDIPPPLVSPLSDMYLMGYDVVDHTMRTLQQQQQAHRSSL